MTTISNERHTTQLQQRRWAATSGQLDIIAAQTDHMLNTIATIRDQGAPEPVLEDLTTYLARTQEARKAITRAARTLWNQTDTNH
ncbi:hypothetical protein EP30_01170 [Bifidobacterium sp. UTCIF-39]|uniref:hypothetical protein n=1 Tax=Bifidobacterium sp. UTCIF-39 TaxID=1465359 RepID=UPI00112E49DD|nr:hypothetical protein [Bifidobacterium sp. UTCIF-39]TPF97582.1 hypothetical protein EP30_01170 [Bifidobacterium sp. UTCIF-39]